ncbi:MAG: hypothetical protein ACTSO7_10805 [Candidatus Heimdallarchaeota archaeon]
MKPLALCLIYLSNKGLKCIRCYPMNISNKDLKKIVKQSMKEDSKDDEFLFSAVGSKIIASYIFHVPFEDAYIKSCFVFVFKSVDFNPQKINDYFIETIEKLRQNNMLDLELIANILPKLYSGFTKGDIKIKVKSSVSIEIKSEKKKKRTSRKDIIKQLSDDLWN